MNAELCGHLPSVVRPGLPGATADLSRGTKWITAWQASEKSVSGGKAGV